MAAEAAIVLTLHFLPYTSHASVTNIATTATAIPFFQINAPAIA